MRLTSLSRNYAAARRLETYGTGAAAATERLSSGLRINRAADGPGSLPRGIRYATQLLSIRMALQNISQGRSLLDTADSALSTVSSLLLRSRELAVAAANGTLNDSERETMNQELRSLRAEVSNVTRSTTFRGAQIFGGYGLGFAPLFKDGFATAGGIGTLTNTRWASDRVTLSQVVERFFTDSFTDLTGVQSGISTATVDTSGGRAYSPQAFASVVSDSFATLSRVDPTMTTALVETLAGLVQLSQVARLRASDLFDSVAGTNSLLTSALVDTAGGYATQGLGTQALVSDTFADLLGVDGALTTAAIDTGAGLARLPGGGGTGWTTALTGSPGWSLSRVLGTVYTNAFNDLAGTDPVSTAAISGGLATSPGLATTLWSESPNFTLPGGGASWITGGSDSFNDLTGVGSTTGLDFDTLSGVVSLLTQNFTVGFDTFADLTQVDTVQTTAQVDTLAGEVGLNTTAGSQGDSFSDLTRLLSTSGLNLDTLAGTAELSTSLVSVKSESFADASGVGAGSTGVQAAGGQLELQATVQTNNKASTSALFNPGGGAGNLFDSGGILSSSVVDLGGGSLRMYYVTTKNNGSNPAVAYATSTDGGLTWSTGTNTGVTGIAANSTVSVTRDANSGTYYMFYTNGNNMYRRSSANGTSGWSTATTVLTKGSYASIGKAAIVQDAGGNYQMFYEVTDGTGTSYIEKATATSLSGTWTDAAGWSNIAGSGPAVVDEGSQYSLYYNSGTSLVRSTSTDLLSFTAATAVVSTGTGFDSNAVRTGGAVYDAATGTTRMLYLGRSTANGEWSAGLAYTTVRTTGTFVSSVTNTTDTIQDLTLATTENTTSGTITYRVSADSGTTWQTVAAGGSIAVAAGQQVLLEATLTNTGGVDSTGPTLQDFTLSSNLYAASGTLTSTAYTFASPISAFTLTAGESLPAATGIAYEYSADGLTWSALTPGIQVTLGAATSQLQVRASLSTTDRGFTPTLADYTLTYEATSATEYLYTKNYAFTDSIDAFDLSATQSGNVAWEYSTDGGSTWVAAALGANALAGPTQQVQLRARLDAGATAPVISDYTVTAARHLSSGSYTSTDFTFSAPVNEIGLNATESLPAGTSIGYQISTDGGATWQAIANGGSVLFGSPVSSVRLKADFATTDGYNTPALSDILLEGLTTGYATSATYTSAINNVGYGVQNITLNVNESTPAGTAIGYEISTDGGTSWQGIAPGANVAVTPGSSLLLRATLSTTDSAVTPELLNYSVTSEQRASSSVWQSTVASLAAGATAVRLTTTENLLANTAIAYAVSADGGSTWTAVTPGSTTALGTPGDQLVVRATLSSTDPYGSPELLDLTLEADPLYDTAATFTSSFQTLAAAATQVRLDSVGITLPANTGATYEVTNDGGATWLAANPGDTVTFASAGTQVGFRAMLASDGSATPQLDSFALSVPDTATTYAPSAYVYSNVTHFGFDITNVNLNANANQPGGTGIYYEVSTDGGATWTAVSPGSNTAVASGRDLRLRALLQTSNSGLTPELLDYSLTTNLPAAGQEWVSTATGTGSPVNRVRLSVTEERPAGTDIAYYLSTDGGTNFQAIAPGAETAVAAGSSLVLKAAFSTTNGSVARLVDYQLESIDYDSPQSVQSTVMDIGHDVNQLKLDANALLPAGTAIGYELSNDGGASWVAATPGSMVNFATAGGQIALRATLSGSAIDTPQLLDYTISAPMYSTGTLYSTVQHLLEPISNMTLNAAANTPAGTSIQYDISGDGGTTWQGVTPGQNFRLSSPTSDVMARAMLLSSDGRSTAELLDWSLDAITYETSGEFISKPIALPQVTQTVRLTAVRELLAGSIDLSLSHDGGTTWTPAVLGGDTELPVPTNQLLLKAAFTTPNKDYSPALLEYALQGLTDQAPVESDFRIQASIYAGDQLPISLPWVTPEGLGIDGLEIGTAAGASVAITPLDRALSAVQTMRAQVGSLAMALEHRANQQTQFEQTMASATGAIMDADMAQEALDLVRSQILTDMNAGILSADLSGRRNAVDALLKPLSFSFPAPAAKGSGAGMVGSGALAGQGLAMGSGSKVKETGVSSGLTLPGIGQGPGLTLPGPSIL